MEHVVFFPAADGSSAFRRVPSLGDAVRLVERLRNVEGVDDVSVHALTAVPLQFKAYYRVEVPAALETSAPVEVPAQPAAPVAAPLVDVAPLAPAVAPEPVAVEPVAVEEPAPALALVEELPAEDDEPVLVSANGHSKDGVGSLGFFA